MVVQDAYILIVKNLSRKVVPMEAMAAVAEV
jgi:hypothetical protein